MNKTVYKTSIGNFIGNEYENTYEFLGIPYAKAKRFEYCERIDNYKDFDATQMGNCCPQFRQYHPHLDNPERMFYHKEFREGIDFKYGEDCLNLNIYTPKNKTNCPVILYFHGGGFNSGSIPEYPFRGFELNKRGIVVVFANYRVGVLGYLCHEEINKQFKRNGNFGHDDQLQAIKWVKDHIEEFGGDKNNIMLLGQSAGAISIQYHCLNHDNEGLFNKAGMISGGGMFPKFSLPRKPEENYDYYLEMMEYAGCKSFEEFKNVDIEKIFDAYDIISNKRTDNMNNMMPVIDGYLLKDSVDKLIENPLKIDYMLSYTSSDLYAPMMASIANKFARSNGAYVYYFDIDAPGDDNGAFHSCDLRYIFGTLDNSWRPYRDRDYEVSRQMLDYLANFSRTGNPNDSSLPYWNKTDKKNHKVLCFNMRNTKMGRPSYIKLIKNMFMKGNPKA